MGTQSDSSTQIEADRILKDDPLGPIIPTEPSTMLCEAYNNIFMIYYRNQPLISNQCASTALQQCETILVIAARLGSAQIVRPYLALALSQFGKNLYHSVMAEPFRWLKLSIELQIGGIFREAMIHIVGAAPGMPDGLDDHSYIHPDLPRYVRRLIYRKICELDHWKLRANEMLFTSTIAISGSLVAISPENLVHFPTWLVVQIWRDWFGHQLSRYLNAPQKIRKLYRTFTQRQDAYLNLEQVHDIIRALDWSIDAEVLKEDLEIMKGYAKIVVRDLCENKSMLNVDEEGIQYLTSTWVENEDLPWNRGASGE
jgi:hypothetical protein